MAVPHDPRPIRSPIDQQIVEAAEEAMLARGGLDLKVSDVVEATSCSVGTIYTLFGSKAGLIAAVIEDVQREVIEFAAVPIDHDRTPTWNDLIELCVRFERIVRNDFGRLLLVGAFLTDNGETDEHSVQVRQRLLHRLGSLFLLTASHVEQLSELGLARKVDHLNTAGWIYSTLGGAAMSVNHLPPWIPDVGAAQAAIFRTQRQMLAQALLPVDLLNDEGLAPREYWVATPPR